MFRNLGRDLAQKVLQICEFHSLGAWNVLFNADESSDALYILLSGTLGVFGQNNIEIAKIAPVAPVGEMGLITGQPRSATVRGLEQANLLAIKKAAFESLMRTNGKLNLQVYSNVVQILYQRIQTSGRRFEELTDGINSLEQDLYQLNEAGKGLRQSEGKAKSMASRGRRIAN
jgi:CRP-like cAMP-binding protein